jgi:hypothetical protein
MNIRGEYRFLKSGSMVKRKGERVGLPDELRDKLKCGSQPADGACGPAIGTPPGFLTAEA